MNPNNAGPRATPNAILPLEEDDYDYDKMYKRLDRESRKSKARRESEKSLDENLLKATIVNIVKAKSLSPVKLSMPSSILYKKVIPFFLLLGQCRQWLVVTFSSNGLSNYFFFFSEFFGVRDRVRDSHLSGQSGHGRHPVRENLLRVEVLPQLFG